MTNVPTFAEKPTSEGGLFSTAWYAWFKSIDRAIKGLTDESGGLSSGKASVTQPFSEGLLIEFPQDKDYPFVALSIVGTIDEVVTKTATGSCTVTVYIDGEPLGGPANDAGTDQETAVHSERNELQDGSTVTVTVSSNSGAEDLSVTLRGTRTLA